MQAVFCAGGKLFASRPRPGKIDVAFRFDGPAVGSDHTLEIAILGSFARHHLPLTVSVAPFNRVQNALVPVTADNVPHLLQAHRSGDAAQHGYTHEHQPIAENGVLSEFGGVEAAQQLVQMRAGLNQLRNVFGNTISGFVPPFNAMDATTMAVAHTPGFAYISADQKLPAGHCDLPLLLPRTCTLRWLQQAVEEARLYLAMSPTVIMVIHHYDFLEFGLDRAVTGMAAFDLSPPDVNSYRAPIEN